MRPLTLPHRLSWGSTARLCATLCLLLTLPTLPLDLLSLPAAHAAAGINRTISYQGKVTQTSGAAPSNGAYNMRFKLFDAAANGTQLWAEAWDGASTRVTMTGGLFSVQLGSKISMTGSVNFNADSLYLQVEFDPTKDNATPSYSELFSPRRQFTAVPYAFNADRLAGLAPSQFLRADQSGTASGSLRIKNDGVGLTLTGIGSGKILHSQGTLSSSGTLVVKGTTTLQNYLSCSLITTDSSGNLGCGTSGIITQASGDARYVNQQGDTMTGGLLIVNGGHTSLPAIDANVLLEVAGTASGRILRAQDTLASSGTLSVTGVSTLGNNLNVRGTTSGYALKIMAGNSYMLGSLGIGKSGTPNTALEVVGTLSGSALTISNLVSCSSVQTSAAGVFSCGSGGGSTSTFGSGNVITLGNGKYVQKQGDTMTGGLMIVSTAHSPGTIDAGLLLEIAGVMSGRTLHAQNKIESSGSIVVSGTSLANPLLRLANSGADAAIFFQTRNVSVGGGTTSAGPASAATAADDATVGTQAWSNPTNIFASDTAYASASFNGTFTTHYLLGTNFSFSIPSTATILGIKVEWQKQSSNTVADNAARIIKGGVIGTTDKSVVGNWPVSEAYTTYGSSADLWGLSWAPSDINSSTFGTALSATITGAGSANIDHVRITVSYSMPLTVTNRSWVLGSDWSDQGLFKISGSSSTLGNHDYLTITSSGSVAIGNSGAIVSSNIPAGSFVINNGALCVDNGGGTCANSARTAGNIYAKSTSITSIDLAENYPTLDSSIGTGEVLALDSAHPIFVKRAVGRKDERLLGIVSTDPGLLLGGFNPQQFAGSRQLPVALAGRVPVKVNGLGGAILVGDALTASTVPGTARKARDDEQIIGYALESFAGSGASVIQAFVHPDRALPASSGSSFDVSDLSAAALVVSGDARFGSGVTVALSTSNSSDTALRVVSNAGGTGTTVLRVNASGTMFSDGSYSGAGADYAEWFHTSTPDFGPGDVVCIDIAKPNTVRRCDRSGDANVMGIISTHPGFVGNMLSGAEGLPVPGTALVGLIGQLAANAVVEAPMGSGAVLAIRPGDPLTPASIPGYVRKALPGESTVGVALQGLETGKGTINVLVARRNESLTVSQVEQHTLEAIKSMKIEDEVNLMVQASLQHLNVDGNIQDAVRTQITGLDIDKRIQALQAQLSRLRTGTASVVTQVVQGMTRLPDSLTLTGSLKAQTLETTDTLAVGGNARIAGDLSLDGTLSVRSLLVPNGVRIDGTLDASLLNVSGGAVVHGPLTVESSLHLASGATLVFDQNAAVSIDALIVRSALQVMGDITVHGLATFLGDLEVQGQLIVSGKEAGELVLPKSGTAVTVPFDPAFSAPPVITVTPHGRVGSEWWIAFSSATGFVLQVDRPVAESVPFSWISVGVRNLQAAGAAASASSAGNGLAPSGMSAFPVDAKGLPVSSDPVWNSCIRNITILDSTGRPLSCSRYHQDHVWEHPDLHISFTFDNSHDFPILLLPDGYESVTVDRSAPLIPEGMLTDVLSSDAGSSASSSAVSLATSSTQSAQASSIASSAISSSSSSVESPQSSSSVSSSASSVSSIASSAISSSSSSVESPQSSSSVSSSASSVSSIASSASSVSSSFSLAAPASSAASSAAAASPEAATQSSASPPPAGSEGAPVPQRAIAQ